MSSLIVQADGPDQWKVLTPWPTGQDLAGVVYAEGRFLAIGDRGALIESKDGTEWSVRLLNSSVELPTSLHFSDGLYLLADGKERLATSIDAIHWTAHPSNVVAPMHALAHGKDRFVAVGGQGRAILTSVDGVQWIVRELSDKSTLRDVVFAQNRFVAIGDYGVILSSFDGVVWSEKTARPEAGWLKSIAHGNGRIVAVGGQVLTSENGNEWTLTDIGANEDYPSVVFFAEGRFLILGNGVVWESTDGIDWEMRLTGVFGSPLDVCYGDGRYIAVGMDGFVASSLDGLNWMERSRRGPDVHFEQLAAGGGKILAPAGSAIYRLDGALGNSGDEENWTIVEGYPSHYRAIGMDYAGDRFISFARDNGNPHPVVVIASEDGTNWSQTNLNSTGAAKQTIYAAGKYLAVGGGVFDSTDGANWNVQPDPTPNQNVLQDVAFGNGRYVALGIEGRIYISENGHDWKRQSTGGDWLTDIAFGKDKFVALGSRYLIQENAATKTASGLIWTSPDGVEWTEQTTPFGANTDKRWLEDVAYGGGWFVAVGPGALFTSPDGVRWESPEISTRERLNAVEYSDGVFVVAGHNATTMISNNFLSASLKNPSISGNGFTFTLNGQPGETYQVQTTTGLAIPWETIATVTIESSADEFTIPAEDFSGGRFYRAVRD